MIIWFLKNTEVLLETQTQEFAFQRDSSSAVLKWKEIKQTKLCLIDIKKSKLCLYQPQNTNTGLIQSFWGSKVHIIGRVKLILFHAGFINNSEAPEGLEIP